MPLSADRTLWRTPGVPIGAKPKDDAPDRLERQALRKFRPVLQAAMTTALRRLKTGEVPLTALRERRQFFSPGEAEAISDALYRIGVAAELLGRLHAVPPAVLVTLANGNIPLSTALRGLTIEEILNQPPELALEYFQRLGGAVPDGWLEGWSRKSFQLAVTTDATVTAAVHEKIAEAIAAGAAWGRDLELDLEALGVTSANPQYAEMVFRTNVMDAYTSGRWHGVADNPLIADQMPWWEYTNPDDDRTGDDHRENLEGGVGEGGDGAGPYYRQEESFEDVRGDRPFNCFPAGTIVLTERGERPIESVRHGEMVLTHRGRYRPVVELHAREYSGEMIDLHLSAGRVIRVTPAHKFWTRRGVWIEADVLQCSDELLKGLSLAVQEDAAREIVHPHPELLETLLSRGCAREARAAAEDFKPGAQLGKPKVKMPGPRAASAFRGTLEGKLRDESNAEIAQPLMGDNFGRGIFVSAMRLLQEALSRCLSDTRHVRSLCFAPVGGMFPLGRNSIPAPTNADIEKAQESRNASPGASRTAEKRPDSPVAEPFSLILSAQPRSQRFPNALLQLAKMCHAVHRVFLWRPRSHGRLLSTGDYTPLLSVVKSRFTGIVYNLGVAEDASYVAGGVLCANCRCRPRWISRGEARELGLPLDEGDEENASD